MAGKIVADTLEHSTAGSVTTDYVVNGSAKAWVIFDGTGTIAADDSLNLSSLTDSGTGQYAQNFTSSFSATEYSVLSGDNHRGVGEAAYSTTSKATTVRRQNTSDSTVDVSKVSMAEYGDLA